MHNGVPWPYSHLLLFHVHVDNLDIIIWLIELVRLDVLNQMHNVHSLCHAPEYSVLIIQPVNRRGGDEKLLQVINK